MRWLLCAFASVEFERRSGGFQVLCFEALGWVYRFFVARQGEAGAWKCGRRSLSLVFDTHMWCTLFVPCDEAERFCNPFSSLLMCTLIAFFCFCFKIHILFRSKTMLSPYRFV